jgi:hypothetical protein
LSSSTSNLSTSSTGSRSSSSQPSTSSTGFQSNTEASSVFQVPTSSQSFPFSTEAYLSGTTSGPIVSQVCSTLASHVFSISDISSLLCDAIISHVFFGDALVSASLFTIHDTTSFHQFGSSVSFVFFHLNV